MQEKRKFSRRGHIAATVGVLVVVIAAVIVGAVAINISSSDSPDPGGEATKDKLGFVSVDWEKWQKRNPDVIGWINIPDTNISYPIVKGSKGDPNYYLHHDIDGNWSIMGVPYLDADCKGNLLSSPNAVIFGHHIPGSMFSRLASYSERDFAEKHRKVCIQTPEHKVLWRVFSADVINASKTLEYTTFDGMGKFKEWRNKIYEDSTVKFDRPNCDRVMTLVTCSYHYWWNERTVVYAEPTRVDGAKIDATSAAALLGVTEASKADAARDASAAVSATIKAIAAIGDVGITSGDAIDVASYLVSTLSDSQKKKVLNIAELDAAKEKYAALQAEAAAVAARMNNTSQDAQNAQGDGAEQEG